MGKHTVGQNSLHAIAYMLGAVFLLATMDVAFKQLVATHSSLQVTFLRCALSAPIFALWILAQDRTLFRTRHIGAHAMRALLGLLMLFAIGEAFRELALAEAYTIFFAAPLLLAMLSGPVMKEPAGPLRLGACAVGFVGVMVALKPGADSLISYGSAMALVAVVAYAAVALMVRALGRHEHSLTIAFWFTALCGLACLPWLHTQWQPLTTEDMPWVVLLGITGTLGQVMLVAAFKRASAAVIAPLDYTHMIWALLYGWLFWGELPGMRTSIGAAIIIAAGLFVIYRESRGRRRALEEKVTHPLH